MPTYGVPISVETYQGTPLALSQVAERALTPMGQTLTAPVAVPAQQGKMIGNSQYYNPAGSWPSPAVPPMMQQSPYATAAWAAPLNGGVPTPLLGFPSQYPHVVNYGFRDYGAQFMSPWMMGMQAVLQSMQQQPKPAGLQQAVQRASAPVAKAPAAPAPKKEAPQEWTWDGVSGESPAPAQPAPPLAVSHGQTPLITPPAAAAPAAQNTGSAIPFFDPEMYVPESPYDTFEPERYKGPLQGSRQVLKEPGLSSPVTAAPATIPEYRAPVTSPTAVAIPEYRAPVSDTNLTQTPGNLPEYRAPVIDPQWQEVLRYRYTQIPEVPADANGGKMTWIPDRIDANKQIPVILYPDGHFDRMW